jgi:hypothetical protein
MKGLLIGRAGPRVDDIFASMHNGATPNGRRIAGLYTNTEAGRGEGDVVGVYNLPGPAARGFVLGRDGYTTVHVPGATHTRAFGINPAGDIVGHYISGGVTRGYVASRTGPPAR